MRRRTTEETVTYIHARFIILEFLKSSFYVFDIIAVFFEARAIGGDIGDHFPGGAPAHIRG